LFFLPASHLSSAKKLIAVRPEIILVGRLMRFLILVLGVSLLQGCSENLTDDSEQYALLPSPPSKVNAEAFVMDEASESVFELKRNYDSVEALSDREALVVDLQGNRLSVTASEYDHEYMARFYLRGEDASDYLTIQVRNVSAQPYIEQSQALARDIEIIKLQKELRDAFQYYVNEARINDSITAEQAKSLSVQFKKELQSEYGKVVEAINHLKAIHSSYRAGVAPEYSFKYTVEGVNSTLSDLISMQSPAFRSLPIPPPKKALLSAKLQYRPALNAYRVFEGNEDLGEFQSSGDFVYHSNFKYLSEFEQGDQGSIFSRLFWSRL